MISVHRDDQSFKASEREMGPEAEYCEMLLRYVGPRRGESRVLRGREMMLL